MEFRMIPVGYAVRQVPVETLTGPADGVEVVFGDGQDFVAVRFTAEKWAEVLEYLNAPEQVAAAREARARIARPDGSLN